MLEKSYFPATYYFYCGVLLLCFGGTVKQWNSWKTVSWTAAIMVIVSMLVPVLNAWLPTPLLTADGLRVWQWVILGVSLIMIGYVSIAMYQVKRWMDEARDANYSNPDDFPNPPPSPPASPPTTPTTAPIRNSAASSRKKVVK